MFSTIKKLLASLRLAYYRTRLGHLGAHSVIDSPVSLSYPNRISIGDGCCIASNVSLRANTEHPVGIRIGNNVSVTIGNDVLIALRVSINTVSHHADCDVPINAQGIYTDPVVIGDDLWIGMYAVIL